LALALVFASPAAGAAPAPTKRTAKFEVRFMTEMIDHHAMAVEMSEVCLDKAVHAELRAMCQEMIAAQSQEIETMQSWLEDWYGVSHEPEMSRRDMRMIERLAALSGARFEIRFMETMIEHHRQAIAEAERCLDRAYHAELRNLCRQIIEAQSAEIAQLEEWLCVWYGRCHRDDRHGDDDDDDDRHEDDDHGNRHKDRH
jgi:uncharacterized protein (DUF305 family)